MNYCNIERVDLEVPCSFLSHGAKRWSYACEEYVYNVVVFVPTMVVKHAEEHENIFDWFDRLESLIKKIDDSKQRNDKYSSIPTVFVDGHYKTS